MFNNKLLINLIIVGLFFLGTKPAIAQLSLDTSVKTNQLLSQVRFKPPPGQGKPKRTSGAGTRYEWRCPEDEISTATSHNLLDKPSAMALVPPNSNYGLTIAERPTFLVYLPQTSARQVVLSFINDS